MASFGRLSNSLITGINETQLALASLNFDFSLIKVEAPVEYSGIGSALAKVRRDNAEFGRPHRTARKLSALFESVIPQMPKVVAAYGKRSSEIIETPGLNPTSKNEKHGPFAAFVGADATSIWAAATSGGVSIAVHLLACLLARSFKDPAQSASVWAEIVEERQREILATSQSPMLSTSQVAAINAASQPIPRDELREWDASVRAWLQTADSAMRKEHTQLKLILDNITLPVAAGGGLYADVIRSWTSALQGLERLLNGEPQSVVDGAILLAISAWHLFPTLLVLGNPTTKVAFADKLVPPGGVLTIGITNVPDSAFGKRGIYWSAALSHYQYYGRPVKAVGEIDDRLTIEELHFATLGSLLGSWKAPRSKLDLSLQWFVSLWNCVKRVKASLRGPKWLENLATAALCYLEATENGRKEYVRLIDFGQRRGRNFLSKSSPERSGSSGSFLPWFGLRCPHILHSLLQGSPKECGIHYLRKTAEAAGLKYSEALIALVRNDASRTTKREIHEYTTVSLPPSYQDIKAVSSPCPVGNKTTPVDSETPEDWELTTAEGSDNEDDLIPESPRSYLQAEKHQRWSGTFSQDLGGSGYPDNGGSRSFFGKTLRFDANALQWDPDSLLNGPKPLICPIMYDQPLITGNSLFNDCEALLPERSITGWFTEEAVRFTKVLGDSDGVFRLWARSYGREHAARLEESARQLRTGAGEDPLGLHDAIDIFQSDGMEPLLLWQYLEGPDPYEPDPLIKPLFELMKVERKSCEATINSLRSLAFVGDIYGKLDGASISAAVVDTGIYNAKWRVSGRHAVFTKSMVFSCIAMMESGKVNLDADKLDEVIALSSGNSLFVSSRLLNDPNAVDVADSAVTRIVGNVGRPGISLLVPPAAPPLCRPLSSSFRAVNYASFDGSREDNFKGTSLHLSFTSHTFPLDYGASGVIDHQVFLVESVISVHDAGQWVADIDPRKIFEQKPEQRLPMPRRRLATCCHPDELRLTVLDMFATIDTWEEILDIPPSIGLIRAHKNWPARLAASIILSTLDAPDIEDDSEGEAGFDDLNSPKDSAAEIQSSKTRPRLLVLDNAEEDTCWVCVWRRFNKLAALNGDSPVYLIT
ncbi:hypothetical protein B0H63DRAFT_458306 [Podospora didyma]|uniref:Uncharacterized protein n=1 Tax=Podospora didyma TaxID=330526 RepID=A0AAE0P529_9PEZI|nr:hypothetical protein B0H63DRAFT_458306 [Podospora didyma]